jgi:Holliday junction resolvasome RuvABC endonuclease subunit
MTVLLGLDISSRSTATVAIPLDWDGRWSRVEWLLCGQKLTRGSSDMARAQRTESIARAIVEFARRKGATVAFFESYGFNQNTSAHTLAEVAGVVRLELVRAGIEIHTAQMSSARKLLLGKIPVGKKLKSGKREKGVAKQAVYETLTGWGAKLPPPERGGMDVADAIVAANLGLSELGGYCWAQVAA